MKKLLTDIYSFLTAFPRKLSYVKNVLLKSWKKKELEFWIAEIMKAQYHSTLHSQPLIGRKNMKTHQEPAGANLAHVNETLALARQVASLRHELGYDESNQGTYKLFLRMVDELTDTIFKIEGEREEDYL